MWLIMNDVWTPSFKLESDEFFAGRVSLSRPSCVISDPLKAELFKLFQLLLGAVVRTVAAFNPIQQVSFDLLDTEVRTLLLDVFDRLLKSELSRISPDQPALLGVDVNVRHQVQERIQHLRCSLALGRVHPLEKSIEERIVIEDGLFRNLPALLAHDADPLMS